jgi:hypothetical protein
VKFPAPSLRHRLRALGQHEVHVQVAIDVRGRGVHGPERRRRQAPALAEVPGAVVERQAHGGRPGEDEAADRQHVEVEVAVEVRDHARVRDEAGRHGGGGVAEAARARPEVEVRAREEIEAPVAVGVEETDAALLRE